MDDFRIDAHKLMYHPRRVADWLDGKNVYPLYVEISPCSACNHRCIFCAFDYLGHKPKFFDPAVLRKFLKDIAAQGVKSILFSGEGETLLYKELPDMAAYAKERGLDVAVTTNGVLLSPDIARRMIPSLTWLRISLNAGSPKTYALVHGTKKEDFNKVIGNIKEAVKLKHRLKSSCTIGVQFLLLNENYKEVHRLAGILQDAGVDYLAVKPYSQHPRSINRLKNGLDYRTLLFIEQKLKSYARPGFRIIFRKNTMAKIAAERGYRKCCGLPFAAHLTTDGDLYGCSAFLGDERFAYGNVNKQSFEQIWKGKKRASVMQMMEHDWDIANCREVCRLDEINRYLWQLKNPHPHVNFI